jgi:hypothetical protein
MSSNSHRPAIRSAARIFGVLWIAAVSLAAVSLIGSGIIRGRRGEMLLLFGAALPGFLIYRWGRNVSARR